MRRVSEKNTWLVRTIQVTRDRVTRDGVRGLIREPETDQAEHEPSGDAAHGVSHGAKRRPFSPSSAGPKGKNHRQIRDLPMGLRRCDALGCQVRWVAPLLALFLLADAFFSH